MKKQIALLIKSACFLALLCALMVAASYLFMPKNNHKTFGVNDAEMLARGILGEKENSIDVLVVGDSEAYSSISPMQMWEERGFRSYLCSTPAQPLYDSYRFLRQALDRQSPSVVVLETNAIFRPYKLNDYLLSRAKNLFSILRYHDRWKSLKANDFGRSVEYTWTDDLKGFRYNPAVAAANTKNYMLPTDASTPIPTLNESCLQDMIALCKEKNAELILVSTPSTINWNQARHNSIAAFAEENDLTYLDLNTMPKEVPIDWARDTRDRGDHLNYAGAVKVSAFLGKYLQETYSLPDHRDAAHDSSWNDALGRYRNMVRG
nr:SGNH/GDSL hydrolase family protein [uncultured Agathobaculum sp.]